jgi:outer membrane protein assembly factor BamE (lipoprotein component of BamABCDE complex)
MELQVGMSRQQMLSLMGNPYRREVYGDDEFLIYETNHWAGIDSSERFTPVHLKNGKVMGWGRNYYDDAIRSKVEADINIKSQ